MGILPFVTSQLLVWGRKRHFYAIRTVGVLAAVGCTGLAFLISLLVGGGNQRIGAEVFGTFAVTQFVFLLICSTILGASAISRERETGTLEVLLTTHSRPVAIVAGLAAGLWAPLAIGLVGGLPIALILVSLGGVTLKGVLLAYLLTLGATIGALGFATFLSAFFDRTMRVTLAAILILAAYLGFLPLLTALLPWGAGDVLSWLSPVQGILLVTAEPPNTPGIVGRAALWAGIGVALVLASSLPMSLPAIASPEGRRSGRRSRSIRFEKRPFLTLEKHRGRGRLWSIVLGLTIAGIAVLLVVSIVPGAPGRELRQLAMSIGGWIVLVTVLAAAASTFTEDRRQRQLEVILASPVRAREIFWAKAGALAWRMRWLIVAMAVATAVGAPERYLPGSGRVLLVLVCAPVFVLHALSEVALALVLGMTISLRARSSAWAVAGTIGAFLAWFVGVWIVSYLLMAFLMAAAYALGRDEDAIGLVFAFLMGTQAVLHAGAACALAGIFLLRSFDGAVGRLPPAGWEGRRPAPPAPPAAPPPPGEPTDGPRLAG